MTEPSHTVFLSYASQDAQAAHRICSTLRSGGIEVFFDQSELRGGDAWDQKIRHEIHECALFVPIVSANTQHRLEGYFRHEWKLAIERAHHMAEQMPFLVPVVVDGTRDQEAFVPDAFRAVQWTHLPGGETPPAFVERIRRLLSPELSPLNTGSESGLTPRHAMRSPWRSVPALVAMAAVLAALAYLLADRFFISKTTLPAASVFAPPAHSVAVLPFVNLSGDKDQEYFSDGLTEEVLNSLSGINELQVGARTSAFSFKGTHTDIGTIARKLNVGAILEGSVRRAAGTVRISAQLINTGTGFQLWSKSYDRNLNDVLKLQTEIATSVAGALKVTLLADVVPKLELGGTDNPAAFDAYLRGAKAVNSIRDAKDLAVAVDAYSEAIRLDPKYVLAFAARSLALSDIGGQAETAAAARESFDRAQADAKEAIRIAPDLARAHLALGEVAENGTLDFTQANGEYERALALGPGNAEILRYSGNFAVLMGHFDTGIAAVRRAVVLDPLSRASQLLLGHALYTARSYGKAVAVYNDAISLDPGYMPTYGQRGFAYFGLGDLDGARASCEKKPDDAVSQWCLAVVYNALGRRTEAEKQLSRLKAALGDNGSYQYATILAQWGNRAPAIENLEAALRVRDPGLEYLKTDPLLDPLRDEPRFLALQRELKFPE